MFDAVTAAAGRLGTDRRDMLTRCQRFVHGSTVATNAVLTRNLATVGLITTAGFRDTLEIRRGIREDQWDHRAPWPPVLVPRLPPAAGPRQDSPSTVTSSNRLRDDDVSRGDRDVPRRTGSTQSRSACCTAHADDRHEAAAAALAAAGSLARTS